MEKLTYNVPEAAKLLGVSAPRVYDLAHSKDFPAVFIGRRIVIPVDRFHKWLNDQADKPAQ